MTGQPRTPRGVPSGGQFSSNPHDEADVDLGVPYGNPVWEHRRLEREALARIDDIVERHRAGDITDTSRALDELVEATTASQKQSAINRAAMRTPDDRDYQEVSFDAIRESGLGRLSDTAHVRPGMRGYPKGGLAFRATGRFDEVETAYIPDTDRGHINGVLVDEPDRELHIGSYAQGGQDIHSPDSLYVSVSLTDDEALLAADRVADDEFTPDGFKDLWANVVQHWSSGKPEGSLHRDDQPAGGARREWDAVTDAVKSTCPRASKALSAANDLRTIAITGYDDKCRYIGSDKWIDDQIADVEANWEPGRPT